MNHPSMRRSNRFRRRMKQERAHEERIARVRRADDWWARRKNYLLHSLGIRFPFTSFLALVTVILLKP